MSKHAVHLAARSMRGHDKSGQLCSRPEVKLAMALHILHVAASTKRSAMTSHAVHMTARSGAWL